MCTIHVKRKTTLTPEQFVAGLTDFGPDRSKIFRRSAQDYLVVHRLGLNEADVTEGANYVWEHLHYDWSDPCRIVVATVYSNTWAGKSSYVYTLTPRGDGKTTIRLVLVREGKNAEGRLLAAMMRTIGRAGLCRDFAHSIRAIEAAAAGTPAPADDSSSRSSRRCSSIADSAGAFGVGAKHNDAAQRGRRIFGSSRPEPRVRLRRASALSGFERVALRSRETHRKHSSGVTR